MTRERDARRARFRVCARAGELIELCPHGPFELRRVEIVTRQNEIGASQAQKVQDRRDRDPARFAEKGLMLEACILGGCGFRAFIAQVVGSRLMTATAWRSSHDVPPMTMPPCARCRTRQPIVQSGWPL